MTLDDLAIVTYAVDERRLASLLPAGFTPERFTANDGTPCGFVSAVSFRASNLRAGVLPLPLQYAQINYRAYVRYAGQGGVWFFASRIASVSANAVRALWGLPWQTARIEVKAAWDADRCTDYSAACETRGEEAALLCEGTGEAAAPEPHVTDPLVGFARSPRGAVLALAVAHAPLKPKLANVRGARFTYFERLGLIEPNAQPDSVRLERRSLFAVNLPPRRIA